MTRLLNETETAKLLCAELNSSTSMLQLSNSLENSFPFPAADVKAVFGLSGELSRWRSAGSFALLDSVFLRPRVFCGENEDMTCEQACVLEHMASSVSSSGASNGLSTREASVGALIPSPRRGSLSVIRRREAAAAPS